MDKSRNARKVRRFEVLAFLHVKDPPRSEEMLLFDEMVRRIDAIIDEPKYARIGAFAGVVIDG